MVMNRPGGPEVLEMIDRPEPIPGPGEALVEIAAAGVNFMDIGVRRGAFWTEMPDPKVLGSCSQPKPRDNREAEYCHERQKGGWRYDNRQMVRREKPRH
jgi:hypothetical protein